MFVVAISVGQWAAVAANPADIIGPILSPHQAGETWQGQIAGMLEGIPGEQTHACVGDLRRPWVTVDVRDVAEAHIKIYEKLAAGDPAVSSGDRYLLSDMTRIHPEDIGARLNDMYPQYNSAAEVGKDKDGGDSICPIDPLWDRVQARNDMACNNLGVSFTAWDVTLRDTVESLVSIGGVTPRLR